jgi:hypothetical protein
MHVAGKSLDLRPDVYVIVRVRRGRASEVGLGRYGSTATAEPNAVPSAG